MSQTVRPPRPGDVAAVAALGNAFDIALSGEGDWTEADVEDDWRRLADPARDAWLVERGGALAGYATVRDDGDGVLEADGYVHPDHFGHGVGAALVDLAERRAAELVAAGAGLRLMRTAVLHADAAARRLFEARGYRPVHYFMRMRIDMDAAPPPPRWPDGVSPAPFRIDADAAAVNACVEEAFVTEWSHRPGSQPEWTARKLADPRFDPSLWIVARAGGEVCGVALCTAGQFGMGFVNTLAVRERWRRRGLGLALLHAAFGMFYDRGERRVGLGVDADNPTGARRLYERAGMRSVWQADVYERRLAGRAVQE